MNEELQTAKKPRRPCWPRFTLRVLLAVVTVLCVGLAIWTHRAREQARVVRMLKGNDLLFYYDYQLNAAPSLANARSPVPQWLIDLLGIDFFHSVKWVLVCPVSQVETITRLRSLEYLVLVGEAVEPRFDTLSRCRQLKMLEITSSNIDDQTLVCVGGLPEIEHVALIGTEDRITARGLAGLARAKTLRYVDVRGCADTVTALDVQPFRVSGNVEELMIVRGYRFSAELVEQWWPNGKYE